MNYLDKYKVGSPLFRTLSEVRMRLNILSNSIRYTQPPPEGIVGIHEYLTMHVDACVYTKRTEPSVIQLPETVIVPELARPLLDRCDQVEFPESFVLHIPDGRVLGDGTVIVEGNVILSETTTDFHRKQEYHHLLSEKRIPKPESFNGRLAVIASPGSDNYFHWTVDSVPRFGLLEKMKAEIDAYYVNDQGPFHREWLVKMGIPTRRIISASPNRHIRAKQLIVPSFFGLPGLPVPAGLDYMRNFIPAGARSAGKRIYISRATARRRRIVNEDDILPLLQQHGFDVIHPGNMSVSEQMKTFASAEVLLSPHGAELANLVYCSPGTKIIEILSPYYLNPCFKILAGLCGLQHIALVGKGGRRVLRKAQDTHFLWANVNVDMASLEKQLNQLSKTTRVDH